MMRNEEIAEAILNLVKTASPPTVESLVEMAEKELKLPRETILKRILDLENQGKLKLTKPPKQVAKDLRSYTFSIEALWFWITTTISLATTVLIFTVPETMFPLVYLRYLFGSVFVLFLPGYSLIKTLFPTREIDNIERTALSIGMSLALVPLVGLLLNYSPWGIRLTPITLSLLTLTTILSTTGLIREHQEKSRRSE